KLSRTSFHCSRMRCTPEHPGTPRTAGGLSLRNNAVLSRPEWAETKERRVGPAGGVSRWPGGPWEARHGTGSGGWKGNARARLCLPEIPGVQPPAWFSADRHEWWGGGSWPDPCRLGRPVKQFGG